ncbi:MAG: BREX system ATP-binding domain-containing protein [Nitrospinota bacterium]
MNITPAKWLDVLRAEYLQGFVRNGGAAVKVTVVSEEIDRSEVLRNLNKIAEEEGFFFAGIDAAKTKVHMIDHIFHEVARQVDWDGLARAFIYHLLERNGLSVPSDPDEFHLRGIAAVNGRDEILFRQDFTRWLEQGLFHDYDMCYEFRLAMIWLCRSQVDRGALAPHIPGAIHEWLRGELRLISALKGALISQKVARHNARDILFSLAHWLKLARQSGLVLALDVSRCLEVKPRTQPDDMLYYSTPAVLDAYEVLRQFIDGTDEVGNCLICVFTTPEFVRSEKRGMKKYVALWQRIEDEVRDKRRANPLAAMVRISNRTEDRVAARAEEDVL